MASRFGPGVLPTGVNPLAEAIDALRSSFAGAAEGQRRRQREAELDAERQEDRQFVRDQARRSEERQDFRTFGQIPVSEAPTVQEEVRAPGIFDGAGFGMAGEQGGPNPLLESISLARENGRPAPAPPAARPGAFVPGVGFSLPTFNPPAADTRLGLQRPATTARPDPRFEQVGEDRFVNRELLPEERKRNELVDILAGLQHVGPDQARALAAGVPVSVAMPRPAEAPTITVAGREFPDTPEGRREAIAWRREHASAGRDPNARRGESDESGRTRGERSDLRRTALTRIENMLAAGAPREQVAEVMKRNYPDVAGVWTNDDIVRIERSNPRAKEQRRLWDEMAADARRQGLDPETAIGFPRP
jgi:Sec-independent protein translocase protein TatA